MELNAIQHVGVANTHGDRKRKRKQNSILYPVHYSGIGIHTGEEVSLSLLPAPAKSGVVFRRVDLPSKPEIPATCEYVFDTSRSTNICIDNVRIYTVEHLLAALRAYNVDNVIIELSGIEPPAGNGSSDVFVQMIEEAKVVPLEEEVAIYEVKTPLHYSHKDAHIVVLPAEEYRISYTLHYPQVKALGTQFYSFQLEQGEIFKREIASCRTFALYDELSILMDKGLIKGGSLDNAVVIKDRVIMSKEGLFFKDEMVRHKILDLIGDLSLVGVPFLGHVIAIRSGHAANLAIAKQLFSHFS